jgi:hypothetical protein
MSSTSLQIKKKAARHGDQCSALYVRVRSDIPQRIRIVLCVVQSWNFLRRTIPGGRTTSILAETDFPFIAGLPSLKGGVVTEFPAGM